MSERRRRRDGPHAARTLLRGVREERFVAKSLKYLKDFVQSDGGVYAPDKSYKNYETCLAILCFSEANRGGRYAKLIKNADKFVKDGWSVKKLHREILLSSVYRQSSDYREDIQQADADNQLLAVFPRKRLEAEEIRDSILFSGAQVYRGCRMSRCILDKHFRF